MKILVADYICTRGHRFFNSIHINALKVLDVELEFVSRKNYFEVEGYKCYDIPEEYYVTRTGTLSSLKERFDMVRQLNYIKKIIQNGNYDKTIFLTYDTLSMAFFRTTVEVILISHVNIDLLPVWYYRMAFKSFPLSYKHVVLGRNISSHAKKILPQHSFTYIPHGILSDCYADAQPLNEKIIYCPIKSSVNEPLFRGIATSKRVNDFLKLNNIKIIVKGVFNLENTSNIKFVEDFIGWNTYKSYLKHSLAVFLPYDSSFCYRVSGVFHECLSNNTPVITSSIYSFEEYSSLINYKFMINSDDEFIEVLQRILSLNNTPFKHLEELHPTKYWSKILNCK